MFRTVGRGSLRFVERFLPVRTELGETAIFYILLLKTLFFHQNNVKLHTVVLFYIFIGLLVSHLQR
jgi:hypothetical protein